MLFWEKIKKRKTMEIMLQRMGILLNLSYCCVITSYTADHGLHSLGKGHNISAVFQGPRTSSCQRILQGQLRLAQHSEQTEMSSGSSRGWQTESLSWRGHVESQKILIATWC